MCLSAPRVCSETGGQKPVLSLSLDLIGWHHVFMWLVGRNMNWDCLVPHCIMGSRDQWEFPPFFRPQWQSLCTAPTAGKCMPLGLCKGTVKESSRSLCGGHVYPSYLACPLTYVICCHASASVAKDNRKSPWCLSAFKTSGFRPERGSFPRGRWDFMACHRGTGIWEANPSLNHCYIPLKNVSGWGLLLDGFPPFRYIPRFFYLFLFLS